MRLPLAPGRRVHGRLPPACHPVTILIRTARGCWMRSPPVAGLVRRPSLSARAWTWIPCCAASACSPGRALSSAVRAAGACISPDSRPDPGSGLLAFVIGQFLLRKVLTMRGYDPAAFEALFTATIAASAALTGLLFVAISINLKLIVEERNVLATRAAETLATMLLVVVASAITLIPQNTRLMGVEILVVVLPVLLATVARQPVQRRQNPADPLYWTIS